MTALSGASFDDVVMYSLELDGAGLELADGFRLTEFASRCGCDTVLVHPQLVEGLVELKEWAGGAVVRLNSAYRSPRHNKRVGGRQAGRNRGGGSRHLYGMAADVDVLGKTPRQVQKWAQSVGWGGVGSYRTFTHLDCWSVGRTWSG